MTVSVSVSLVGVSEVRAGVKCTIRGVNTMLFLIGAESERKKSRRKVAAGSVNNWVLVHCCNLH